MKDIKSSVLNMSYVDLMNSVLQIRRDKSLSVDDVEYILMKALLDIRQEKETLLSAQLIQCTYQIQQLEQEKKKSIQEQSMQIEKEEHNE